MQRETQHQHHGSMVALHGEPQGPVPRIHSAQVEGMYGRHVPLLDSSGEHITSVCSVLLLSVSLRALQDQLRKKLMEMEATDKLIKMQVFSFTVHQAQSMVQSIPEALQLAAVTAKAKEKSPLGVPAAADSPPIATRDTLSLSDPALCRLRGR